MNTFVCLYFGRLLWIKAYLRKEETCSWRGQVINSKHLHNIVWYSGFIRTLFFVRLCFQHLFNCWHSTVMLNLQKKTMLTDMMSQRNFLHFISSFPHCWELEARHQNHNGDPKFLLPAAFKPRGPIVFISSDLTFWGQQDVGKACLPSS